MRPVLEEEVKDFKKGTYLYNSDAHRSVVLNSDVKYDKYAQSWYYEVYCFQTDHALKAQVHGILTNLKHVWVLSEKEALLIAI
jgi:hypothetical protein